MILVILLSIVLALLCYAFYVFRMELFRISERQSNMIMHVARMNRGLLSGISTMFDASRYNGESPAVEDDVPDGAADAAHVVEVRADGPDEGIVEAVTEGAKVEPVTPHEEPGVQSSGDAAPIVELVASDAEPTVLVVEPPATAGRKKKRLHAIPEQRE